MRRLRAAPYKVDIQTLPNDASQQREQLVRRLAAKDSSIDLMSLDPPFVAEFANAGFLRVFDKADEAQLTKGVLDAPLKTVYWDDKLVAAPFWANTQLLWYRKSAAKAAGVDPASPDFTWDDMIKAAVKRGQGHRRPGEPLRGLHGVDQRPGRPPRAERSSPTSTRARTPPPTIASPAGDAAAKVVGDLARSKAAPPAMSTAGEEEARSAFQGDRGMFMVNWPYVYAAAKGDAESGAIDAGVVDDIGWARYPEVIAGEPSKPPLGGINLAIGEYTKYPTQAAGAGQVPHLVEVQRAVHGRLGKPGGQGCRVRRPGRAQGVPDGGPDP